MNPHFTGVPYPSSAYPGQMPYFPGRYTSTGSSQRRPSPPPPRHPDGRLRSYERKSPPEPNAHGGNGRGFMYPGIYSSPRLPSDRNYYPSNVQGARARPRLANLPQATHNAPEIVTTEEGLLKAVSASRGRNLTVPVAREMYAALRGRGIIEYLSPKAVHVNRDWEERLDEIVSSQGIRGKQDLVLDSDRVVQMLKPILPFLDLVDFLPALHQWNVIERIDDKNFLLYGDFEDRLKRIGVL